MAKLVGNCTFYEVSKTYLGFRFCLTIATVILESDNFSLTSNGPSGQRVQN